MFDKYKFYKINMIIIVMVIKDNFLPFNPEFSKLVVNKGCKLRKKTKFLLKIFNYYVPVPSAISNL